MADALALERRELNSKNKSVIGKVWSIKLFETILVKNTQTEIYTEMYGDLKTAFRLNYSKIITFNNNIFLFIVQYITLGEDQVNSAGRVKKSLSVEKAKTLLRRKL